MSQPDNRYEPIDPAEAAMLLGKTNSTNSRPEKEQAEYAMVKKNDRKEVCIEYPINVATGKFAKMSSNKKRLLDSWVLEKHYNSQH